MRYNVIISLLLVLFKISSFKKNGMAALEQQKPQSAAAGSNAKMLLHGLFMPLLFSFGVWRAVVVVLWWLYYV